MARKFIYLWITIFMTISELALAAENRIDTIRSDAPALAPYGKLAIGVKTVKLSNPGQLDIAKYKAGQPMPTYDRPLTTEVWYPALLAAGQAAEGQYRVLVDSAGPLHWRVPQVKKDPSVNKWFIRWIVLRENRYIIGSMSFHGPPDESGMLEIGLGIESPYQNQGFAKEALLGMWQWALVSPEVKRLRYTVSPANLPSVALIRHFQFPLVGSQIDEVDGVEEIYEMEREHFIARWSGI